MGSRRTLRVTVIVCASAALVLTIACAGILGIEDRFFDRAGAGDAHDDSSASGDAGGEGDAKWDGACPSSMVLAGSFCIDATEVTEKAYQAFLESTKSDASGQIAACGANGTFKASETCKPFTFDPGSTKPMVCIDWCDAYAYCAWAGKRLCGLESGGGAPIEDAILRSTSDQWFSACTKKADGRHPFPYGSIYEAGVCNDKDREAGAPIEVGSAPGCVGGYDGVFDMSGNVWEWEDACNDDAGTCVVRGGSYTWGSDFFPDLYLSCGSHYDWNSRGTTGPDLGFRCCLP